MSMGNGRWSDSGDVACDTAGRDRGWSLVSNFGRIGQETGCMRGVVALLSGAPWQRGVGLLSLTSIASGSPRSCWVGLVVV